MASAAGFGRRLAGLNRFGFERGCTGVRRRRIEGRVIGRDVDQRGVIQILDDIAHDRLAALARLIGFHLGVKVDRALAGNVGHTFGRADAVLAVAANACRLCQALAVG